MLSLLINIGDKGSREIGQEEKKLPCFTDNKIVYRMLRNVKIKYKKQIRDFSNTAVQKVHKVIIQKSVVFLYASNEQLENGILKIYTVHNSIPKHVKMYKISTLKIQNVAEGNKKWRVTSCLVYWKT